MKTSRLFPEDGFGFNKALSGATLAAVLAVQFASAQSAPPPAPQSDQTQTVTAPSPGRHPVQTKTQEEYKAYQVAIANSLNPEAMEKAADDFAAKFPASDARVLLYRAAMSSYQSIGDSQKMMDMGMRVLAIDKDDPEALVGVAETLEEHTAPTDLDRQQRGAKAIDYANHALQSIDTDLAVPAGTPPERVESYKRFLRATALGIIGTIYYKQENYAAAETKLRESLSADPANPDAVTVLRLALALDQEKKFNEAIEQAKRAVDLTKEDTEVGRMARTERDRLVNQGAATDASAPAPPAPAQGSGATGADPKH